MKKYASIYLSISKPRIVLMVLVTTFTGFFFASSGISLDKTLLFWTLLASYFLASGSSTINHYMEKDVDALMVRTSQRPLPQGKLSPARALTIGFFLLIFGLFLFNKYTNVLTTGLALSGVIIYNLIYTPLKKRSWYNTFVGSIPGALPPLWGWTAMANEINSEGIILFLILLCWQQPHFFAIAWMMKSDYQKANLKMLPVIDGTGKKTFLYILLFSLLLIPVSLLPSALKMTGNFYFFFTFILSLSFFLISVQMSKKPSLQSARSVFLASILYLPLLLIIIMGDLLL